LRADLAAILGSAAVDPGSIAAVGLDVGFAAILPAFSTAGFWPN